MQPSMVVPRRDDDDVPTDKAWAIHAAIIGLNTGNLLFRGLELDPDDPGMITVYILSLNQIHPTFPSNILPHQLLHTRGL